MSTVTDDNTNEEGITLAVKSGTRAEWAAFGALALNIGTILFVAGQVVQQQHDQERRIVKLEATMDALVPKVERIDANVEFLAEQAREQREADRRMR